MLHHVMRQIPSSFITQYGEPIVIRSDDDIEAASDDSISWHLLNRACDASNLAFTQARHPALRVFAAYLPNLNPRAFAYWSSTTPQDYVIACTRGTCEVLRRELINADLRSLLSPTSLSLRRLHADDLTNLAVSLVMATILYHEVAHIVRFHLPYLTECKANEPAKLSVLTGLCEAEADKWCSYLIAPDLLAQAKGIHTTLGLSLSIELVLREVLALYGVALHLWFSLFNQDIFPKSSIYPHPLIRSTRITIGAADNIPALTAETPHAINRACAVLDGLAAVEQASMRSTGSKQHPFDLAEEMIAINEKYLKIEQVLDPALREVRSRWSSPDAA